MVTTKASQGEAGTTDWELVFAVMGARFDTGQHHAPALTLWAARIP